MLDENWVSQLTALGLKKYEARAYLALLGHEKSSAVEVANRAQVPRQRIYDVLASLLDWGIVVTTDGRPLRHTARHPAVALPSILEVRRIQQLTEHERLVSLVEDIIDELKSFSDDSELVSDDSELDSRKTNQAQPDGQKLLGGL
jgi:sugar-specific transcriptional regulator TrmB